MNWTSCWRRVGAAFGLCLAVTAADAAYYRWETVTLPASSGASCGNGTPYRFFVNRALSTKNVVMVYEGGGACWDQRSCEGKGRLSASNAQGVPSNYMTRVSNTAAGGLVTPFSSRLNPFQRVRTQSWNMVYLPYCTGDVHTGSSVRTYSDADPAAPRVQYHRGMANAKAAADWLRRNWGRPDQLLLTGFSAGGVGATATYGLVRDALSPRGRASLVADSGPMFSAPSGGTAAQYPSLPLHTTIRKAWGLDEPTGLLATFAGRVGYDPQNLASVATALAARYPKDRFGYAIFGADETYSAFSYEKFYPEIAAASGRDKSELLKARLQKDIDQWLPVLAPSPNVSWYVPWFRDFNSSHCLTVVDFSGTGIEERKISSVGRFVDNTLDRGTPMRERETDQVSDLDRPLGRGLQLLLRVLDLFG